jgi:hypothetical protein
MVYRGGEKRSASFRTASRAARGSSATSAAWPYSTSLASFPSVASLRRRRAIREAPRVSPCTLAYLVTPGLAHLPSSVRLTAASLEQVTTGKGQGNEVKVERRFSPQIEGHWLTSVCDGSRER